MNIWIYEIWMNNKNKKKMNECMHDEWINKYKNIKKLIYEWMNK